MKLKMNQQLRGFLGQEDGNVTIFSVFMMVLMLLFTGAAVDIMRFEAVRTSMQSTIDRAVLAAADLDQEQVPRDVVLDYLDKAGIPSARATVWDDGDETWRTVKATAHSNIDTIFMHMSGYDTLYAPARAKAFERIANVEISLALDISGSMRDNGRMDNLKPAAKAFVDKVLTTETDGVTTLNVVPYAGQVNPGGIMFDYLRGERPKIQQEDDGAGDVDPDVPVLENGYFTAWSQAISNMVFYFDSDGDGSYDGRTDHAHKIEGFPETAPRDADDFFEGAVAYIMDANPDLTDPNQFLGASIKGGNQSNQYFQVKGDVNGHDPDLGPTKNAGKIPGETYQYNSIDFDSWEASYVAPEGDTEPGETEGEEVPAQNINTPGSCIEIYDAEFSSTDMPLTDDSVPYFNYWPIDEATMDWGWCPEDDTSVQYYADNAETLKTFIDNLRMHDGTGIHFGMKYALALLSPATRDDVSYMITQNVVSADYEGRPKNWDDRETEKFIVLVTDGAVSDQYRPTDPDHADNGTIDLQTQGPTSYEVLRDDTTNATLLQNQCTLAKDNGVTVFTIAFEANATGQAQMKSCASSPSHYFEVSGSEISDTFDVIARQINNLRLVQ